MADTSTKTALDVITGALRKIGQYSPGETLSSEDANDALDIFNGLLDILSTQHFAIYNNVETVVPLTTGKSSYTLGTGGDISIERPLSISQIFTRITTGASPVDFPCDVWPLEQYSKIGLKNQPGPWPKSAYYNTSYPLATLYLWPVPNAAAELHIFSDQVLSNLNLTDLLNLPRGYFLFLQYELATLLAPEYGVPVPPAVAQAASQMRASIKSLNARPQVEAPIDGAVIASNGNDAGFFLTGGF